MYRHLVDKGDGILLVFLEGKRERAAALKVKKWQDHEKRPAD